MKPEQALILLGLFFTLLFPGVALYEKFHWGLAWEDAFYSAFCRSIFIAFWMVIVGLIYVFIMEILTWDSIPFPLL